LKHFVPLVKLMVSMAAQLETEKNYSKHVARKPRTGRTPKKNFAQRHVLLKMLKLKQLDYAAAVEVLCGVLLL